MANDRFDHVFVEPSGFDDSAAAPFAPWARNARGNLIAFEQPSG